MKRSLRTITARTTAVLFVFTLMQIVGWPKVQPDETQTAETIPVSADQVTGVAQTDRNWSGDRISRLLEQLGSASFADRQTAASSLQTIPSARIEELVQMATQKSSSEVIRRVYEFLETCYASRDGERNRVAGELIESAVNSEHWMTAELSGKILQRNGRIRVTRSLIELQTLGASVSPENPNDIWHSRFDGPVGIAGFGSPNDQIRIGVGEAWKGEDRGMQVFQRLRPLVENNIGVRGLGLAIYLIDGHPLGEPQITLLKATFGDRRIVSRGKVCLGITSDQQLFGDTTGCRIGQVRDGSSAGDAGLEQSDVILKLNGEDVKDFDHLVQLLKQFKPGDKVTMTVRRPGAFPNLRNQPFQRYRTLDVPVTLKGWDDLK
jgi:PDZ domain